MIPGVSTAVILRQTLRSGRSSGVAALLGNETGIFLWAMAAVFAMSFLPQFVPQGAHVPLTLTMLAVVWVVVDVVWYVGVIWLIGRAGAVLGRPAVRRRLEQVSGTVLVALGVRVALEAR
ncbi:LysE family transporter [Microbispora hainanensis]|uniref:LysE family translocator n=1 Tax=Microbispora hainanensis TaxID=568844 RepID=A0A544YY11_9ACTN|nr:LysE family transporter [Microbispora hainanensis]TQS21641.1 hypothetical protein FLX08_10565 [Microbispora hainanensis]